MSIEKLRTEIRQDQISRVALNLVASYGLKKLTLANVARKVGLVPSAIYRHFASKEEMLDSVLKLIRAMLQDNVTIVCQETTEPLERLKRLLFSHVRLARENQGIPRIIFGGDIYEKHPERKTRVYESIKGYLHRVSKIISQGQESGAIRPDLDPEAVAVMFLGLIQPAAILWHLSDGRFDVTKQAEKAWHIFQNAIQKG